MMRFIYSDHLDSDIDVIDMIRLFELGLDFNLVQLSNRVLKLIPKELTVKNFDEGWRCALDSYHNGTNVCLGNFQYSTNWYKYSKRDLISLFQTFISRIRSKLILH